MLEIKQLTDEQKREVYLQIKREYAKKWRDNIQSDESKAKRREYMKKYMRRYRAEKKRNKRIK